MRRHEDDGVDAADPKVSLFVSLNKPRLQLSRFQCHTLLNKEDAWGLAEPWAPDVLRPLWPTPPIRPVRGPSSDTACFTRIWWQYALNVVLHSVSAKRPVQPFPVSVCAPRTLNAIGGLAARYHCAKRT